MKPTQIKHYLAQHEVKRSRTIVIVDYGNVEKWKVSLGWLIGIAQLARLVRSFSTEKKFLRRFYYGADYGPHESGTELIPWSRSMLEQAAANSLEVVSKRVKYIHSANGYEKKCDLDVEMTVDLIRERDNYDTIVLFSGDGDLVYALKYLHETYGKEAIVFGARDHVGREIFDAKATGVIKDIFFAEDFEYRLNRDRMRN